MGAGDGDRAKLQPTRSVNRWEHCKHRGAGPLETNGLYAGPGHGLATTGLHNPPSPRRDATHSVAGYS